MTRDLSKYMHDRTMKSTVSTALVASSLLLAPAMASADTSDTSLPAEDSTIEVLGTSMVARTTLEENWRTEPTTAGWALPTSYIGWGNALVATSGDNAFYLTVPEANGHALTSIEFTAELSGHVDRAAILTSVEYPTTDATTTTSVMVDSVTISGATAVNHTVVLPEVPHGSTVIIEVIPDDTYCVIGEESEIATLSDPVLFFEAPLSTEEEAPAEATTSSVAVPDVATNIVFQVDDGSSTVVDQAVLTLAADLASHFEGEQRFSVVDTAAVSAASPFAQTIRVVDSRDVGIRAEDAMIVVAGRDNDLLRQAAGLSDVLASVETISDVVIDQTVVEDLVAMDTKLIADITGNRLRVAGSHSLELPIELDQADFGGPVSEYQVRIDGIATPTRPSNRDEIELALWVDDELLEVIEIDDAGRFSIETVVYSDAIERVNTLRLVLDGTSRACGDLDNYSIQIDSGSWVKPTAGQVLDSGVSRFPQVAADGLIVDVGSSIADLGIAADTIGLMQETTQWPLRPTLSSDQTTSPNLMVNPDAESLDAMGAPINSEGGRITTDDTQFSSEGTDLDNDIALQAFTRTGSQDSNTGTDTNTDTDTNTGAEVDEADAAASDDVLVLHSALPTTMTGYQLERLSGNVYRESNGRLVEIQGGQVSDELDAAAPAALALQDDGLSDLGTSGRTGRELFASTMLGTLAFGGFVLFLRRRLRN